MTERDRDTTRPSDVETAGNMGTLSGFGANQVSGDVDRQPTDRRIHEEICTILVDNPQVPIEKFDAEVADGQVTLHGDARDEHTRQRAADLIAMIVGVKGVRNDLRVSSTPPAQK